MVRMTPLRPDEIARGLKDAATVLSGDRRLRHLESVCSQALLFMATARHVELDSDRGDPFLIEQLTAAAKDLDSSLLDVAAARLRSLSDRGRRIAKNHDATRSCVTSPVAPEL
jgi:hypothetical protein